MSNNTGTVSQEPAVAQLTDSVGSGLARRFDPYLIAVSNDSSLPTNGVYGGISKKTGKPFFWVKGAAQDWFNAMASAERLGGGARVAYQAEAEQILEQHRKQGYEEPRAGIFVWSCESKNPENENEPMAKAVMLHYGAIKSICANKKGIYDVFYTYDLNNPK